MIKTSKLFIDGFDFQEEYNMLMREFSCEEAQPKTYEIDVAGRSGKLDYTESVSDDVAFDNYTMTFVLWNSWKTRNEWARTRTALRNLFNGKRTTFTLSWDEGYTYTGRFSFTENTWGNNTSEITLTCDCEPYKTKGTQVIKANAFGGIKFEVASGRKPVCPIFEVRRPCFIYCNGAHAELPAGKYKAREIFFHHGTNEIYLNTSLDYADVKIKDVREMGYDDSEDPLFDDASGLIEDYADWFISELFISKNPRLPMTIEMVEDTKEIWQYGSTRIIEMQYPLDTDADNYAVFIYYDWSDL